MFDFLLQAWIHLVADVCSRSRQMILHADLGHQLI